MKYFLDTEFIEGFHKPFLGKKRHFIDLISIGIVGEDGREYYAISKDFNPRKANKWVRENVLSKLPDRNVGLYDSPRRRSEALLWKSNEEIAMDLMHFFKCEYEDGIWGTTIKDLEFWGYYADYDWVLFCSLFGTMMDWPKGFPMYCCDLKQWLDARADTLLEIYRHDKLHFDGYHKNRQAYLLAIESQSEYPKQTDEHNALADAKWNRELYKFLETPFTSPTKNQSMSLKTLSSELRQKDFKAYAHRNNAGANSKIESVEVFNAADKIEEIKALAGEEFTVELNSQTETIFIKPKAQV